jgi:sugar lactone lactonase YvrE
MVLVACGASGDGGRKGKSGGFGEDTASTTQDTQTPTTPTSPTVTGDTAHEVVFDCSTVTDGPFTGETTTFVTEEDFDFHPEGYLLSQSASNLLGLAYDGSTKVFATGLGGDVAGIRTLATGDIAVAQPDLGTVMMVSADGGSNGTVVAGMTSPNGLAAADNGTFFVAEFAMNGRVTQFDPYGVLDPVVVASGLTQPNGLALSPDGTRLYIALYTDGIVTADQLPDGTWSAPAPFYAFPTGSYYTLATDVCGNVYTVNYSTGEVYRISPDGLTALLLVDLDSSGAFSSIRFGNGEGGFERDVLYVTRRSVMYAIVLGVPGRKPVYQD